MKIVSFEVPYGNTSYSLHKTFGLLLELNFQQKMNFAHIPERVINALKQVENPYILDKQSYSRRSQILIHYRLLNSLAKVITSLCIFSFIIVRILSYLHFPIFNTTEEAIFYYRKLFPGKQKDLCLPRVLFAAITSKSFKKNGVLFIGAFLPSRSMHSWIIENNLQPDPFDDIWICYQPVAILYK